MTHDENTAMERSYHPTGAELWFLLSLLDDRPAPLFWPMGEPAENWPLVAVRLLDAGLAVRGENGLTPAAPLAPLLDTVKSADRAALVFLRTPGGAVDAVLYYNRVGGVLLRRESAARYTLQALDTAALLAALPPLDRALVLERVLDGLDYAALARIHGRPAAYLRTRYHRAKKQLASRLREGEHHDE